MYIISNLVEDFIKKHYRQPFIDLINKGYVEDIFSCEGIYRPKAKEIKRKHRNQYLLRGRADFDEDYDNLSARQKVDLYCFYYFPMHFLSSHHVLHKLTGLTRRMNDQNVYFIDVGCGPFTSGLAFHFWLKKQKARKNTTPKSVNYIGFDSSSTMIDKAKEVTESLGSSSAYQKSIYTTDLGEISDNLINLTNRQTDDLLIILNYSYVCESHSFKVSDHVDFTNTLLNYCETGSGKMVILYQNPQLASLQRKWTSFKSQLNRFKSAGTWQSQFSYDDFNLFGASNNRTHKVALRFEVLKSF